MADAFDRLATDDALRRRLHEGALATGRQWTLDRCVDQLEALFAELTDPPPRAVFLGKTNMPAPPTRDDEQKYAINGRHVSSYVVCTGRPAGLRRPAGAQAVALPTLQPAPLGSAVFYGAGPLLALRAAARAPTGGDRAARARSRRSASRCCGARSRSRGARACRSRCTATGAPRRACTAARDVGCSAAYADRVAEWTLRRADRVRVVSDSLAKLVRDAGYDGPMDQFIAYSDYDEFLAVAPVRAARRTRGALRRRARAVQGGRRAARRLGSSCTNASLTHA